MSELFTMLFEKDQQEKRLQNVCPGVMLGKVKKNWDFLFLVLEPLPFSESFPVPRYLHVGLPHQAVSKESAIAMKRLLHKG